MKIFNRIIAMILVFASICTVIPTSVYAKTVDKNTKGHIEIKVDENGNPTEETINEISESLEFIVEEALILDSDGGIIGVDANKLIKRFGHSPNLDKLAEITNKEIDKNGKVMPYNAFTDCMIEAIKDYFGVGLVGILTSGTVCKLITEKAWKEVVKIIAKSIVKIRGKYIGVASIIATLIYYEGKCAYKSYAYVDLDNGYFMNRKDGTNLICMKG
ncbi:hypothetical protein [Anaerococcus nagyae]|jgi:hypothetical protein|uniref:Uncharacterized protein n=1 Tax=Anaerococcus nagyae TaxID=1755241 RepID=A0A3E2TG16_9FIRM|nr:hypothetical protein [Anaerococcus nagyae]RGB74917.1 hypothetical protein DXA39_07880 [Anaerococcus nagyae]